MRKNDNNPSEYMTIVTTSVQKEKENKLLPPRVSTAMLYVKEKATKPILQPVSWISALEQTFFYNLQVEPTNIPNFLPSHV